MAAALALHCVLRLRPLASEKEGEEESDRAGSAEGAVETEQGESLAAAGAGGEARRRRLPRPRPGRERSVQTALGEGEEGEEGEGGEGGEGGEPSPGAGLKRKAGAAGLPPGAVPAAVAEAEAMEVEQAEAPPRAADTTEALAVEGIVTWTDSNRPAL